MINSMTGYGRAEALQGGRKWVVEIKSLNHRYLEIFVRLPSSMQPLEGEIKKQIGERLSRGRIEVSIRMDPDSAQENVSRIELNLPMIEHYHLLLTRLKEALNLKEEITLSMLAGFKDAFTYQEMELDLAGVWGDLRSVLEDALNAMTAMRQKEGESIGRDISMRLSLVARCVEAIALRAPQVVIEYHNRLSGRVKELSGLVEIDEARLAQEVAVLAERMDITEEIIRFRSHLDQFDEMLAGDEAVGRKVDFLLQEMNREVNTMGAKSSDTEISRQVVEIKSELLKMREQVQNIE